MNAQSELQKAIRDLFDAVQDTYDDYCEWGGDDEPCGECVYCRMREIADRPVVIEAMKGAK
jgi:7-cyano-7-deazaguanine synthase in queuosine biosynthesis